MVPPTNTPLGLLATVLWPLVLLPLWLRFFAAAEPAESRRWSTRTDLGLAVLCGIFAAAVCAFWMPRYFMDHWALSAWDFSDYCGSLGVFRDDPGASWNLNRSVVAGLLPGLLVSRLGIFDALLASAVVSHVGTGAGIYLWGRALHGRTAGLAAVLLSCAVAPLVELPRTITFYPEIVAVCVLSAAGAALALRFRTLPAIVAGSTGIGWVLLIDFRWLLFALPELAIVVVAAWHPARGGNRARVRGLLALAAALVISWFAGSYAFVPGTVGLEAQTMALAAESGRLVGDDSMESSRLTLARSGFVWGSSSPLGIPRSLFVLLQVARALPDSVATDHHNVRAWRTHFAPWIAPSMVALILLAWGLRRRLDLLAGFLSTCAPFAVSLWVGTRVWAQPRYLSHGMAIIPVLLGAGFAVLLQGARPLPSLGRITTAAHGTAPSITPIIKRPIRERLAVVLVALCVLGVIPSWLGPSASWRRMLTTGREPYDWAEVAETGAANLNRQQHACVSALQVDIRAGLPVTGRLFPLFPRWGYQDAPEPVHKPPSLLQPPDSRKAPGSGPGHPILEFPP